jgi:hypothetical protein
MASKEFKDKEAAAASPYEGVSCKKGNILKIIRTFWEGDLQIIRGFSLFVGLRGSWKLNPRKRG